MSFYQWYYRPAIKQLKKFKLTKQKKNYVFAYLWFTILCAIPGMIIQSFNFFTKTPAHVVIIIILGMLVISAIFCPFFIHKTFDEIKIENKEQS